MQRNLVKDENVTILSAISLAHTDTYTFSTIISKAYSITDHISKDYPNHFNWYWSKTIPGVLVGTREVLVCTVNEKVVGVAFLKNEDGEQKLCTFFILEEYRGNLITTMLLEESFKFLGTTKPLISMAEYKLPMFKRIIAEYEWEQTQILDKGYYNNTSREIVFNGKIS